MNALDDLDVKVYHQGGVVLSAATACLPFLVTLAESGDTAVRTYALEVAGRLAAEAARVPARAVDDAWPAAWEAALPRLLGLAGDPCVEVRRNLPSALAGSGAGQDRIIEVLRGRWRDEEDRATRLAIVQAVGELAGGCGIEILPETLLWLRELRRHPDRQIRLTAVKALADAPGSHQPGIDLDVLVEAVNDDVDVWNDLWGRPSPETADEYGGRAASLLGWIDRALGEDVTARTDLCLVFLRHADGDRRIGASRQAAAVVGGWRSAEERLLPALAERTADPVGTVRAYAVHVLAAVPEYGGDPVADLLAERLDDDRRTSRHGDARVADIAMWGLAWRKDPRCLPRLMEHLTSARSAFDSTEVHGPADVYTLDLPSIHKVLSPLRDHAEALLPVIRDSLRTGGPLCRGLTRVLSGWGAVAAPAVPELVDGLGGETHAEALEALGAIGPAAAAAVPTLERLLRRPPDLPEWAARRAEVLLPWAYWKITGDPAPAVAVVADSAPAELPVHDLPRLAEMGHHAAFLADRLRPLLRDRDDWTRTRAAAALHRLTGDPAEAAPVLCSAAYELARERPLPVHRAALRHLRDMPPEVTEPCHWALREVLAADRRHGHNGGWRGIAEDHEIRTLAHAVLTAAY
ncbi:HEAT repeat domain-containing protein [Thermomonospora amylolytica]|uniref:HEAT repeat domain-containing protein n=1 Tax=Thermomonospora amylolytica TaxID=1411117 RepID=UPI000E6BB8A3|nr:HEAT repeat domain-containing protein [Thermomonospora amylolytica]